MSILEQLELVQKMAGEDEVFRKKILETRDSSSPVMDFCRICSQNGFNFSAMELVAAGEESYAAMKRSTNGGGENSPMLEGEDDLYEMLMDAI